MRDDVTVWPAPQGVAARVIADALGSTPLHKITRRTLSGFLREFVDRAEAAGNRGTRVERLRMLLGSAFLFAVERDWLDVSPAQRLPLPAKSEDRSRTLSAAEIATVWCTLSSNHTGIGEGLRLALKISLVTGQRTGTVAMALEIDLDLEGAAIPSLPTAGRGG